MIIHLVHKNNPKFIENLAYEKRMNYIAKIVMLQMNKLNWIYYMHGLREGHFTPYTDMEFQLTIYLTYIIINTKSWHRSLPMNNAY